MIAAIVAVDNNWGIGYNGELLETIPADLKHFKDITDGYTVVMGRKCWESLPKKPLPGRMNMVISNGPRAYESFKDDCATYWVVPMNKAIDTILNDDIDDYFIIGGGQIYDQLLRFCDLVYVTKIYKDHENVDTYFPNLDDMDDWYISSRTGIYEYNDIKYSFLIYERV